MKLLFLSHRFYPFIGGIGVNSEILARSFHQEGIEVCLVTWTEDAGQSPFPFKVVRQPGLLQLLQWHRWADVVFENNPCMRLAWPSLLMGKPTVVALRTWVARDNEQIAWQDKPKKLRLHKARRVIAVSKAVARHSFPPAIVIGNPYRSAQFRILQQVPRTLEFVFLGRLVPTKGCSMAIEALHLLNQVVTGQHKKNTLTIIGSGPLQEDLMAQVNHLGLSSQVVFTGPLEGEALVTQLSRHRFLLVPSLWEEPFGNVALEGMACGCVPIVSDGGGLPDAIGAAGVTFQRGNTNALVHQMHLLLGDSDMEHQLRAKANAHLIRHQPQTVAQAYLNVIKSALS